MTDWLPDHPGGVELVVDVSGKDATADFNDVGHSEFAHDLRKKYVSNAFNSVFYSLCSFKRNMLYNKS